MTYTAENIGNGFQRITATVNGEETVFDICVASEDQIDEVVGFRINELENPNQEPKITHVQKRVSEYPTIAEQLDYIYHNGIEAWKTDIISPIKAKYPKE